MRALVLAGGSGKRLRPITYTSAKQLLPVANKPVLFYVLEHLRDAGITDVGVVVGSTAPKVQAAIGDGSQFGLNVSYIQQEAPLGLAHAVLIAKPYLGDDDFVMYLGDNFIVGGVAGIVDEFLHSQPDAQILLTQVSDPRQFGVAQLDSSGRVIAMEEKPTQPKSNNALVGVYIFKAPIHDAVRTLKPSRRGELEITEAIQWLVDSGYKVESSHINGYWKDTGNVTDMLEVNRMVLELNTGGKVCGQVDKTTEIIGNVTVQAGAQVRGSRILGPVIIGTGATIERSYIGPFTSIGAECIVTDCELEYSIMLDGSQIEGVRRIEASLIGRHAKIRPASGVTKAHRFVLADHSELQVCS